MMKRRTFVAGLLMAGVTVGSPAVAQSAQERQKAEEFLRGILGAARGRSRAPVEQFIRQNVDLQYGYEMAVAPAAGIVSEGQRQRLFDLMIKFVSMEVLILADYANGGRVRMEGTRRTDAGTLVEASFSDSHGEYPFNVLVARPGVGGQLMVRDMGSPRQSSVMTKLASATQSLAQVTPDAEVWISSFERTLAGT